LGSRLVIDSVFISREPSHRQADAVKGDIVRRLRASAEHRDKLRLIYDEDIGNRDWNGPLPLLDRSIRVFDRNPYLDGTLESLRGRLCQSGWPCKDKQSMLDRALSLPPTDLGAVADVVEIGVA
jgi:hypothetical protein